MLLVVTRVFFETCSEWILKNVVFHNIFKPEELYLCSVTELL